MAQTMEPAATTIPGYDIPAVEAWIAANLPKGGKLGFDPWLQTVDGHERFARAAARAGGSFVPVERNPIDVVWRDRPAPPLS